MQGVHVDVEDVGFVPPEGQVFIPDERDFAANELAVRSDNAGNHLPDALEFRFCSGFLPRGGKGEKTPAMQ
jgi:hypothetical protein